MVWIWIPVVLYNIYVSFGKELYLCASVYSFEKWGYWYLPDSIMRNKWVHAKGLEWHEVNVQ